MALPKRNPLVWMLYILSILGMFGFIGWLLLPYASNTDFIDDGSSTAAIAPPPAQNWQPQPAAEQTKACGQHKSGQTIAGISITLQLDGDLEQQVERHWQHFAKLDIAHRLGTDDPKLVYAVYHRYDADNHQVRMTLGYPTPPSRQLPVGYEAVALNSGSYLPLDGGYVLDSWADPRYQRRLKFDADYERYLLDSGYNILGQTAFLALK